MVGCLTVTAFFFFGVVVDSAGEAAALTVGVSEFLELVLSLRFLFLAADGGDWGSSDSSTTTVVCK